MASDLQKQLAKGQALEIIPSLIYIPDSCSTLTTPFLSLTFPLEYSVVKPQRHEQGQAASISVHSSQVKTGSGKLNGGWTGQVSIPF